jgi:hypothetical protein
MENYVWLSNSKLQDRVRELLFKYRLAQSNFGLSEGRLPAHKDASNLIVSYIADRIAKRAGLNTITDAIIPYTVQTLDALEISTPALSREGEGLLASAVAMAAVPAGIERLDAHVFQELRQSFADIRAPFHELVDSLAMHAKLHRQESAAGTQKSIERAIDEYCCQMKKYRATRFARKFDKWTPVLLTGLLGLLANDASKEIQRLIVPGIFLIEVIKQRIASQQKPLKHEDAFRMLCRLEKKVNQKAVVAALL